MPNRDKRGGAAPGRCASIQAYVSPAGKRRTDRLLQLRPAGCRHNPNLSRRRQIKPNTGNREVSQVPLCDFKRATGFLGCFYSDDEVYIGVLWMTTRSISFSPIMPVRQIRAGPPICAQRTRSAFAVLRVPARDAADRFKLPPRAPRQSRQRARNDRPPIPDPRRSPSRGPLSRRRWSESAAPSPAMPPLSWNNGLR